MNIKTLFIAVLLLSGGNLWAGDRVPGNVIGRHIFAIAMDADDEPLMIDGRVHIFPQVEFDKAIEIEDGSYVISGFGGVIGGLYLTRCEKHGKRCVDTSAFHLGEVAGLTRPRGGVATPWRSVLFGETEVVDGRSPQKFAGQFAGFYKGNADLVKPYNYGWLTEAVVLDAKGDAKLIKNYAVGRVFASELFLMPDGRTLYLFDRDNHGLLYLFIADEAENLSSGTLYGVSIDNGEVVYDSLGNASALKMKFKLNRIGFDELYDTAQGVAGTCPVSFVHVTVAGDECLKLKSRNRAYAGLFEPARTLAVTRGDRPLTRFDRVQFEKGSATLVAKSGAVLRYVLGQSDDLQSLYLIKESQQ